MTASITPVTCQRCSLTQEEAAGVDCVNNYPAHHFGEPEYCYVCNYRIDPDEPHEIRNGLKLHEGPCTWGYDFENPSSPMQPPLVDALEKSLELVAENRAGSGVLQGTTRLNIENMTADLDRWERAVKPKRHPHHGEAA